MTTIPAWARGARQAATDTTPTPEKIDHFGLVEGEPLALILHSIYSGTEVTVVDSPPGGGKSTLVAEVVSQLRRRPESAHWKIREITPTRQGAIDLAKRAARVLEGSAQNPVVALQSSLYHEDMEQMGIIPSVKTNDEDKIPFVNTAASLSMSKERACDLLVVDEAYQMTFADFCEAADEALQLLVVGDPGQIGPVVTTDASHLSGRILPTDRAPEVLVQGPDVTRVRLPATYRLGADTAEVIAPLYDFDFDSRRPPVSILTADSITLPEIEPVVVDSGGQIDEISAMAALVPHVQEMVDSSLIQRLEDGSKHTRKLTQEDVAVVVSHTAQEARISALLQEAGLDQVVVGTADRLQGGEWICVLALDPLFGYTEAIDHSVALGRLCVMLSRHVGHLRWVHDDQWEQTLTSSEMPERERQLGLQVREMVVEG